MTHVSVSTNRPILAESLDTLVIEHGKWRVVMAAVKAMVRGKRRVQTIRPLDLPPHLRADIGLPHVVDPPPVPAAVVMLVYARP